MMASTTWTPPCPYQMGVSEPFLGRALCDRYREKVKLAIKMPHWNVRKSEDMDRFLAAQLANPTAP